METAKDVFVAWCKKNSLIVAKRGVELQFGLTKMQKHKEKYRVEVVTKSNSCITYGYEYPAGYTYLDEKEFIKKLNASTQEYDVNAEFKRVK